MTSSTIVVWTGILASSGLVAWWWDVIDFLLDRVGPPRAGSLAR
jgi:hypothetical protein